jgi:hypothetical protein
LTVWLFDIAVIKPLNVMMKLTPYLSFNGQCEEAFELYERCLRGKIECMMAYDAKAGEYPVPPSGTKKSCTPR